MSEPNTQDKIPFEAHPLHDLYKAGRQQWNRFMAEYLNEQQKAKIIERNATMAEDFKAESTLPFDQTQTFKKYMGREIDHLYPINFKNYIFEGYIDFGDCLFPEHTSFENATFSDSANFDNVAFSGLTDFNHATFSNSAYFEKATFSIYTSFNQTIFSNNAYFESATFSGRAYFEKTTFSKVAGFYHATFSGRAYFEKTTFSKVAGFYHATFSRFVNFNHATFSDLATFENATFSKLIDFNHATFDKTINFLNTEFKSSAYFNNSTFKQNAPKFHEAKLHQDTSFDKASWPQANEIQDRGILSDNQFAYNRLTLEMNKQLRYEDELFFFAKELETKRQIYWLEKEWATWFLNYLYHFVSGYGLSIFKPFLSMALLFMSMLFTNYFILNFSDKVVSFEIIFRYTLINFSLGGPILQNHTVNNLLNGLHEPLILLDAINSFASILILICIFLVGLALRNRFRIR